jgi:hypothetical protein
MACAVVGCASPAAALRSFSMHSNRKQAVDLLAVVVLALVFLAGSGCESDDTLTGSDPPYDLMFALDATFQAPHGGQPIEWAVVRTFDDVVVAQGNGTVSSTANPSFSFTAGSVLDQGEDYEVHYWIDSNIGGGTPGVCDPKAIDHQWSVGFLSVTNDINFITSYQPALTEDVCATFP